MMNANPVDTSQGLDTPEAADARQPLYPLWQALHAAALSADEPAQGFAGGQPHLRLATHCRPDGSLDAR